MNDTASAEYSRIYKKDVGIPAEYNGKRG